MYHKKLDITVAKLRTRKQIPAKIRDLIFAQAKGSYQHAILTGGENWSGSSLTGTARQYGSKYAASLDNLFCRINDALPSQWLVDVVKVLQGEPCRWRVELTLIGPSGTRYLW